MYLLQIMLLGNIVLCSKLLKNKIHDCPIVFRVVVVSQWTRDVTSFLTVMTSQMNTIVISSLELKVMSRTSLHSHWTNKIKLSKLMSQ